MVGERPPPGKRESSLCLWWEPGEQSCRRCLVASRILYLLEDSRDLVCNKKGAGLII